MKAMRRGTVTKTNGALIVAAILSALGRAQAEPPSRPVYVSPPVVPTITPAVRDLPDWKPDPNLFGPEMKRRDDFGFIPNTALRSTAKPCRASLAINSPGS